MYGFREVVHGADVTEFVTGGAEVLHVAGEGRGVTAYVHELFRGHLDDGVEGLLVAALSWRVDADDVNALVRMGLIPGREDFFGRADVKLCVRDAVQRRILAGVLDGLRDDLDTVDLLRLLTQEEGDRADTAVEVPDIFRTLEVGEFKRRAVHLFGLHRVHLVEAERGDAEADLADGILDVTRTVEVHDLRSHDNVRIFHVHGEAQAVHKIT